MPPSPAVIFCTSDSTFKTASSLCCTPLTTTVIPQPPVLEIGRAKIRRICYSIYPKELDRKSFVRQAVRGVCHDDNDHLHSRDYEPRRGQRSAYDLSSLDEGRS